MRDLAPGIVRQRLLVEATFTADVDEQFVDRFLHGLAHHLGLRTYAEAMIVSPGGSGRAENEGFDAFLPLIDSGISLYVWTASRFLACVLFTCKSFDVDRAIGFIDDSFATSDRAALEF